MEKSKIIDTYIKPALTHGRPIELNHIKPLFTLMSFPNCDVISDIYPLDDYTTDPITWILSSINNVPGLKNNLCTKIESHLNDLCQMTLTTNSGIRFSTDVFTNCQNQSVTINHNVDSQLRYHNIVDPITNEFIGSNLIMQHTCAVCCSDIKNYNEYLSAVFKAQHLTAQAQSTALYTVEELSYHDSPQTEEKFDFDYRHTITCNHAQIIFTESYVGSVLLKDAMHQLCQQANNNPL